MMGLHVGRVSKRWQFIIVNRAPMGRGQMSGKALFPSFTVASTTGSNFFHRSGSFTKGVMVA